MLGIRTADMEEKNNACSALARIVEALQEGFYPYIEQGESLSWVVHTAFRSHSDRNMLIHPARIRSHDYRCPRPGWSSPFQ